ncbi:MULTISPECIES: hypothetical protein [unclassified Mesorhizobium]|uniref:hypothetical protein n=1 Tax=unclassified Mesorhizobium TaxID=325217 RepID=UPI001FED9BF5|nr:MULTISPECIES: hypothetical protein [unclassified Mesorhizobium]
MPHDTPLIATIVAGLGLAFIFGHLPTDFASRRWSAISSPACWSGRTMGEREIARGIVEEVLGQKPMPRPEALGPTPA